MIRFDILKFCLGEKLNIVLDFLCKINMLCWTGQHEHCSLWLCVPIHDGTWCTVCCNTCLAPVHNYILMADWSIKISVYFLLLLLIHCVWKLRFCSPWYNAVRLFIDRCLLLMSGRCCTQIFTQSFLSVNLAWHTLYKCRSTKDTG